MDALVTNCIGGAEGDRTPDLMTARDAIASSTQFTCVRLSALERMFVRA